MKKPIELVSEQCKIHYALAAEVVSKHTGFTVEQLQKKTRSGGVPLGRYTVFALLNSLKKYPDLDIGGVFGCDHVTVAYGLKTQKDLYETDFKGYKKLYDAILEEFQSRLDPEEFSLVDPQKISFYDIIRKIEQIESAISMIKGVMVDSYLKGYNVNDELKEKLNSTLFASNFDEKIQKINEEDGTEN